MKMTKANKENGSLSINGEKVTEEELLKAVRKTGMLKELIKEIHLERTLCRIKINEDTVEDLVKEFREKNELNDEQRFKNHLNRLYIDEKIFKEMITRPSKVVRYRNERWGDHVKSLYLKNKEAYDRITYKRVQSNNMNLMQEVYFRLKDKEETWESILSQFPASQGKNGILKDVPAENIEEKLLLQMKNAGKENVTFPININGQIIISELIETKSSTFDENLKTKILNKEFNAWIEETTTNLTNQARIEQ